MADFFLSIIAPLLALAGLSWAFTRHFAVPFHSAPLCAAGTVVTGLYLSDYLSLLKVTGLLLLISGIALLLLYTVLCCRGRISISLRGCVLTSVLLLALWGLAHLNYRAGFTNWDEFSHWGTFTKLLYSEETFHLRAHGIRYYFEDYLPGTALFSYFFLQASGYSEPVVYFAHGLILLFGSLPAIGMALSTTYVRGLLAVAACFLLVMVLGQGWSSALIDHIVGILFGGVVCAYWAMRNASPINILSLVPPLCFLVLSKQTGASFAVLATGLMFADRLWLAYRAQGWQARATVVSPVVLLWALPRFIQASWTWHVEHDNLVKSFSAVDTGAVFAKFFGCCHSDREIATVANFFQAMTGLPSAMPSAPGNLIQTFADQVFRIDVLTSVWSAAGPTHLKMIVLLSGVMAAAALLRTGQSRIRLALFSLAFVAAGTLYVTSLLVYYLYVFSEYEGRAIASHERFINTYLHALALFAVSILLSTPAIGLMKRAAVTVASVLFILLFQAYLPAETEKYLVEGGHHITQKRAQIREFVRPIMSSTDKKDGVYIVWESTSIQQNGLEFWMMHYELRPRNTNHFCFSLGPPQYQGDVWSCPMNEDQVRAEFARFPIVAVGNGLNVLQKLYPQIFAETPIGGNEGVFETFRDAENKTALRPLASKPELTAK